MRKIMNIKYISMIALAAALVGCSKNGQMDEDILPDGPVFSADFQKPSVQSKVTHTDDGNALKLAWVKSDKIGIWTEAEGKSLQSNSAYLADQEGAGTTFSYQSRAQRIRWAGDNTPQSFYACYPYNADRGTDPHKAKVGISASQSQYSSGSTAHLAENDFIWAAVENVTKSDDAVNLTFHHPFSILDLELTTDTRMKLDALIFRCTSNKDAAVAFENGSIDLSTGELDLTGATTSPEVRLDCDFATSWPAASHVYMVFNPALAGETMQLVAVIGGKEKLIMEKQVPEGGFPAGKVINVVKDYEVPGDVAIKIKDLGEISTSNSYLVSEANQFYKFKATVKGNGYIPAALSEVAGTADIAPKSVLVLWYNTVQKDNKWVDACPILLSSLVFFRDYVYFDTPKEFVPGNVVIAAFAEEGVTYDNIEVDENKNITNATLLWSWNIWAAEGYDPEATAVISGGKTFMDRFVGAAISGKGTTGDYIPAGAVGNYYQWGRKDPFPAFSDYTITIPTQFSNILFGTPTYTPIKALKIDGQSSKMNLDGQMFGYRTNETGSLDSGNAWNLMKRNDISSDKSTKNKVYVDYATAHPYKCITNDGNTFGGWRTWLNGDDPTYKSLWGSADHHKTLFDPCPAGWRVPSKDEATEFVNLAKAGNLASNLHGMEFQGSYFPITGSRDCSNFGISYVRSVGVSVGSVFWTSDVFGYYSYVYAAVLDAPANFSDKYEKGEAIELESKLEYQNNANGNCVRCVKE